MRSWVAPIVRTLRNTLSARGSRGKTGRSGPARRARLELTPLERRDLLTNLVVNFGSGQASTSEPSGYAHFCITLADPYVTDWQNDPRVVTFDYTTVDGTAVAGEDYTPVSGSVTFSAATGFGLSFQIPIVNDLVPESVETFDLVITNVTGATAVPAVTTVTVADDDAVSPPPPPALPEVNVVVGGLVLETGPAGSFTFTRTGDTSGSLKAYYAVSGTAGTGVDYAGLDGVVTFQPGSSDSDVEYYAPIDDLLVEGEESVVVTLVPDPAYTIGGSATGVGGITDDDLPPPTVTVVDVSDAAEGGPAGAFEFTRTGDLSLPLTIEYDVDAGAADAATFGTDYNLVGGTVTSATGKGTVTFAAGSATATVTVSAIDDPDVEPTETVTVVLQSKAGYDVGSPAAATLDVLDNDVPSLPTVQVISVQNAIEGGQPGYFILEVGPGTGPLPEPVDIFFTLSGTATHGTDYLPSEVASVRVTGYGSIPVLIDALPDCDPDLDETVILTISPNAAYTIGSGSLGGQAALLVIDVAPPPAVIGNGTGLFGRYYNNQDLSDVRFARIDETVNFNWGTGRPVGAVGADHVSARWTGKVMAKRTDDYTFHVTADDGVRLWVDGKLILDKWTDQPFAPPGFDSEEIALEAGKLYDIKLDYYENEGAAAVKLEWSCDCQPREVIPKTQLYPNTSTIGDRVWLDSNGNGRQDDAEPGVGGVGVRILEANGRDAVPAAITKANGTYGFVVPAEASYILAFTPNQALYGFTTPLVGDPVLDSDAKNSGSPVGVTALFTAPTAGNSDLTRDAGLRPLPLVFDLDVNANGSLGDAVDGAANYLPGYEGNAAKIVAGNSYNGVANGYTGQRMKLILDGIGTDTEGVAGIDFEIRYTTEEKGYASNRSTAAVEGQGRTGDYSFYPDRDADSVWINGVSTEQVGNGGHTGGRMEPTKTWVNFYCKDYGGAASVTAKIYVVDAKGKVVLGRVVRLDVPRDDDRDGLADKWEDAMYQRWILQYQEITNFSLGLFSPGDDSEQRDPDGVDGPLVDQKGEGDAHTVFEEYRGYILDGGGVDGQGGNAFAGGHIRLDPARKEVLLEVDKATVLNNVPAGGLRAMLNGAASVFSNDQRGAGIYVYWLMDQTVPIALADVDDTRFDEQRQKLADTRNDNLKTDFLHILFFDEGVNASWKGAQVGAQAFGRRTTRGPKERGLVFATTDVSLFYKAPGFQNIGEAYACVLAHEITHLLMEANNKPGFNAGEHTTNPDPSDPPGRGRDWTCLLFAGTTTQVGSTRANREFATVRFFPVVQAELDTGKSEGLV